MEDDVLEKTTFWISTLQAAHLNNYLARTSFRFIPHEDLSKYCSNVRFLFGTKRSPYLREQSIASSKNSEDNNTFRDRDSCYGQKRPMDSFRDAIVRKAPSSPASPKINRYQPPIASIPQNSQDLLNRIKEILLKDFPDTKGEFDFEILDRGIKNGYYINLEEFKVAARQVIRAFSVKHSRSDCSHLIEFKFAPQKSNSISKPPEFIRREQEISKMEVDDDKEASDYGHNSFGDNENNSDLFGEEGEDSKSYTEEKPMKKDLEQAHFPLLKNNIQNERNDKYFAQNYGPSNTNVQAPLNNVQLQQISVQPLNAQIHAPTHTTQTLQHVQVQRPFVVQPQPIIVPSQPTIVPSQPTIVPPQPPIVQPQPTIIPPKQAIIQPHPTIIQSQLVKPNQIEPQREPNVKSHSPAAQSQNQALLSKPASTPKPIQPKAEEPHQPVPIPPNAIDNHSTQEKASEKEEERLK